MEVEGVPGFGGEMGEGASSSVALVYARNLCKGEVCGVEGPGETVKV